MEGSHYGAPEHRSFNLVEAFIGVIVRPAEAMRQIALARPWPFAIALAAITALISGFASIAAQDMTVAEMTGGEPLEPAIEALLEDFIVFFQSPALPVVSALFAPFFLAIGSGILYLCGRLLGGHGPYSALYSTQAFASVPSLIAAPFIGVFNLVGGVVASLGGCLNFFFTVWVLVLTVLGIRESLNLSTGRAIGTLLIPLAVVIGLFCVVFFLIFAAAIGGSA